MSRPRFAAITSDLLARKGEARPWEAPPWEAPLPKQPLAWQAAQAIPAPPPPLAAPALLTAPIPTPTFASVPPAAPANFCEPPPAPVTHASHGDLKKIMVRLSHHDYERLGLLAVKRNATRQRLLQQALDSLLAGLSLQFGSCACLRAEDGARD